MTLHFFIAGAAFVCLFVVFLALSRTLGNIIHQLAKLEYVIAKDIEFKKETLEIQRALQEDAARSRGSAGRKGEKQEDEAQEPARAPSRPAAPQAQRSAVPPAGGKKPA